MIVIVSENVLQSVVGTSDAYKLHTLLGFACKRRHIVYFDPPNCIDAWLMDIDGGARMAYQKAIKSAGRAAKGLDRDVATLRIDQIARPEWDDHIATLPLDDALKVLEQKLGFLLENNINDWHFLLGIMARSQRERVLRAMENDWVEPLHGGGSGILENLKKRLRQPHQALRTVMMFDSDRLHPRELAATWKPGDVGIGDHQCAAYLWEVEAKKAIPNRYWRLQRRFIESYMPEPELIQAVPDGKAALLEAYWRMSTTQRWFYNLKKGFAKDEKHQRRQGDLYESISAGDKAALQLGCDDKLSHHFEQALERDFNWDAEALEEARTNLPKFLRLL